MKKRLGTETATQEELAQGFVGPERKVWLNIYRVNNHATKETVENHIKKQPGFENLKIMVSELSTKFCCDGTSSQERRDEEHHSGPLT
ncbi:unnamed protein product [Ceutorhynchus assimilis]|uniref:Uncharacterized protein n=1 Tax=Ceutorhynchus assimilis TaxID=467358 RepID=A0A9N9MGX9_9CUCU|nr:unnamed protein product [Ceutorhynchus assimilis]